MIKWYLVLYILGQGSAINVLPAAYETEQQCKDAAKIWGDSFRCIQAPASDGYKGYVCQSGASVCQVVK